jgi:hypothetical protein
VNSNVTTPVGRSRTIDTIMERRRSAVQRTKRAAAASGGHGLAEQSSFGLQKG